MRFGYLSHAKGEETREPVHGHSLSVAIDVRTHKVDNGS